MIKVLLLTKYGMKGASSRLRTRQYLPYLRDYKVQVEHSALFSDSYVDFVYSKGRHSILLSIFYFFRRLLVLCTSFRYDVIWIEKELFPYAPAWAERLLYILNIPYIVDYDDAIFHNYDLSKSNFVRRFLGRKIDTVMKHAQTVVAGSSYLESRAILAGASHTIVIPTVVDVDRYPIQFERTRNPPVIGWIGSPSTEKYVAALDRVFIEIRKRHHVRFIAVGATKKLADALPGIDLEIVPWDENTEADYISQMTVGIMPLFDGPWEKGKCGYKLIQYMACQIPVIASGIGVNAEIIDEETCGFVVTSDDEWLAALEQVLLRWDIADKMGVNGRRRVEECYSIQANVSTLARVLKGDCKSRNLP